jgi:hypothetical protein
MGRYESPGNGYRFYGLIEGTGTDGLYFRTATLTENSGQGSSDRIWVGLC